MRRGGADGSRRAVLRALGAGGALAALAIAGCGSEHDNLVNGKQQFVAKCGTCHTMARAGTKGTAGPNLDEAFRRARDDGFKESTIRGMVKGQIAHPSRVAQTDPATGKSTVMMPAGLVTGSDATDVAAYVALAAGTGGQDTGRLAQAGAKAEGTATAKDGVLSIPVNKAGGLLYQYKDATAEAGPLTIESRNDEPVGHDIAIEGNGVDAKGEVVQDGGVSRFQVDLKPGKYTFFCSVPGHRQAGMQGTLTVK